MARIVLLIVFVVLIGVVYIAVREWPLHIISQMEPAPPVLKTIESFQEPQPGDQVRIELLSGAVREGAVREIARGTVMIETPNGEVTYPRRIIAPTSRRLLFRDDFEGASPDERPAAIDEEAFDRLPEPARITPEDLGFGPGVQYVISGTNAIVIFRAGDR